MFENSLAFAIVRFTLKSRKFQLRKKTNKSASVRVWRGRDLFLSGRFLLPQREQVITHAFIFARLAEILNLEKTLLPLWQICKLS